MSAFFNKWAPVFMRRLMADFHLGVDDAAAIIGNAGHESGGFQALQERKPMIAGSRGGYGIMQWTGPRRRAYEAYCKRNGFDPADMDTNYKFLFVELKGPEGRVLPKLRATKTLDAKVVVFCDGFLRPGIPHMESRKEWARRALAAYGAAPASSGTKAPAKPQPAPTVPPVAKKPAPKGALGMFLAAIAAGVLVILKSKGII
jgi:hypothetical protein